MDDAKQAGRELAARHQLDRRSPDDDAGDRSLVRYAESSRTGDWSLRSALVRLAQPEPVRAGAVLELVRRCDGALAPYARRLETVRSGDLARLARQHPDLFPAMLESYRQNVDLHDDEVEALPFLQVAVVLDELAVTLTDWAADGAGDPPPCDVVDTLSAEAFERLESLGVAREQGPPRRGTRAR